jgi:hypothetical protein
MVVEKDGAVLLVTLTTRQQSFEDIGIVVAKNNAILLMILATIMCLF